LPEIHRVIAVNFEFIFEEFHATFFILTVVDLNSSQCWMHTEVVKHEKDKLSLMLSHYPERIKTDLANDIALGSRGG
jgi:hypothetical protein